MYGSTESHTASHRNSEQKNKKGYVLLSLHDPPANTHRIFHLHLISKKASILLR